tara:strand:+ start:1219 stop:1449 length:231 start_codon:yes stop_codon:yes gene_type:complete
MHKYPLIHQYTGELKNNLIVYACMTFSYETLIDTLDLMESLKITHFTIEGGIQVTLQNLLDVKKVYLLNKEENDKV